MKRNCPQDKLCEHDCPCDCQVHPPPLRIAAGLDDLPRQIAAFPDFRRAMLDAIDRHDPLTDWRARGQDDFGIMLLEMWAYVLDVQAFYDRALAQEMYLRPARRRESLRRLVQLIGYLPRPAVAASVLLAALADGRLPVQLPAGLAFRSGAFDGEPPQVFELAAATAIHPLTNKWQMPGPRPAVLGVTDPAYLLLETGSAAVAENDPVLIRNVANFAASRTAVVAAVGQERAADGQSYTRVDFTGAVALDAATPVADLRLETPGQAAVLWTASGASGETEAEGGAFAAAEEYVVQESLEGVQLIMTSTAGTGAPFAGEAVEQIATQQTILLDPGILAILAGPPSVDNSGNRSKLTLDAVYKTIRPGDRVLVERSGEFRWFQVDAVAEVLRASSSASTMVINGNSYTMPGVNLPTTQITLDADLNDPGRRTSSTTWTDSHRAEITVHYGLVKGGTITVAAKTTLAPTDPLLVSARPDTPADGSSPSAFLLQDHNERGVAVDGSFDFEDGRLTLGMGESWEPPLDTPVTLFGNVVEATRGETVTGEVLGSGDASQANQEFKLRKSPLTYIASPTADNQRGVTSTLKVWVDGVLWEEVETFFGVGEDEPVYITRQNDDDETLVIFGDGVRGRRLPSGGNNVVATYRYGAGAAAPPAGSITQIAKPVKGLTGVRQPVAAFGGADREDEEALQTYAPASALVLGRAVSIHDMEAVAAGVAGVRAVSAEWRWSDKRQRPVVQIYVVGEGGVEENVTQTLRNLTDPATPIEVLPAAGVPATLSLAVAVDDRYQEEDVLLAVRETLTGEEDGLLVPERIGIGRPLYRSHILAAVANVDGVLAVTDAAWNDAPFPDFAVTPGAGHYFDLESGDLLLNGKGADDG